MLTSLASADVVFELTTLINGTQPTGTSPFGRLTLSNSATDTVHVKFENLMPSSNYIPFLAVQLRRNATTLEFQVFRALCLHLSQ